MGQYGKATSAAQLLDLQAQRDNSEGQHRGRLLSGWIEVVSEVCSKNLVPELVFPPPLCTAPEAAPPAPAPDSPCPTPQAGRSACIHSPRILYAVTGARRLNEALCISPPRAAGPQPAACHPISRAGWNMTTSTDVISGLVSSPPCTRSPGSPRQAHSCPQRPAGAPQRHAPHGRPLPHCRQRLVPSGVRTPRPSGHPLLHCRSTCRQGLMSAAAQGLGVEHGVPGSCVVWRMVPSQCCSSQLIGCWAELWPEAALFSLLFPVCPGCYAGLL